MILLTMETEHFVFEALDTNEKDARYNLGMALKDHAAQYGLAPNWYHNYDITVTFLEPGSAYRDGQLAYRRP